VIRGLGYSTPGNIARFPASQPPVHHRFVNFHSVFVPNCQRLTTPLWEALRPPWTWTPEHERLFVELKNAIMSALPLAHPSSSEQLLLRTDASIWGLGAVSMQISPARRRRSLAARVANCRTRRANTQRTSKWPYQSSTQSISVGPSFTVLSL